MPDIEHLRTQLADMLDRLHEIDRALADEQDQRAQRTRSDT